METVPKSQEKRALPPPLAFSSTYPPFLAVSLLPPPLGTPRFVMLIVSNSGHHRYVYFLFSSPSFLSSSSAAHTRQPPPTQSLVFVLVYWAIPFVEQHSPFGYHFSDGRLIIFYSPRKYHPLYFIREIWYIIDFAHIGFTYNRAK